MWIYAVGLGVYVILDGWMVALNLLIWESLSGHIRRSSDVITADCCRHDAVWMFSAFFLFLTRRSLFVQSVLPFKPNGSVKMKNKQKMSKEIHYMQNAWWKMTTDLDNYHWYSTQKNTEIRFHLEHVNVFVSLFANHCQSYNCCVRFNFDCF